MCKVLFALIPNNGFMSFLLCRGRTSRRVEWLPSRIRTRATLGKQIHWSPSSPASPTKASSSPMKRPRSSSASVPGNQWFLAFSRFFQSLLGFKYWTFLWKNFFGFVHGKTKVWEIILELFVTRLVRQLLLCLFCMGSSIEEQPLGLCYRMVNS